MKRARPFAIYTGPHDLLALHLRHRLWLLNCQLVSLPSAALFERIQIFDTIDESGEAQVGWSEVTTLPGFAGLVYRSESLASEASLEIHYERYAYLAFALSELANVLVIGPDPRQGGHVPGALEQWTLVSKLRAPICTPWYRIGRRDELAPSGRRRVNLVRLPAMDAVHTWHNTLLDSGRVIDEFGLYAERPSGKPVFLTLIGSDRFTLDLERATHLSGDPGESAWAAVRAVAQLMGARVAEGLVFLHDRGTTFAGVRPGLSFDRYPPDLQRYLATSLASLVEDWLRPSSSRDD